MSAPVVAASTAVVVLLVGMPAMGALLVNRALAPENVRPLDRAGAQSQCATWVDERWEGPDPRLTSVRVEDAKDRSAWVVTGNLSAGDVAGPYSCSISWSVDGGAVHLDSITLPGDYRGDVQRPDASDEPRTLSTER